MTLIQEVGCVLAKVLTAFLFTLMTISVSNAQSPALGPVGTVWGGQHVELEVTSDGATVEFDCATGAISHPVRMDAQGRFSASGTFTRERPGPVMRDNPNTAVACTYSGVIGGNTLRLTVTGGPQNESFGEYELIRGQAGRVVKCK